MKSAVRCVFAVAIGALGSLAFAQGQAPQAQPSQAPPTQVQAPPVANPDVQYRLGPDSLAQEGVPKGEVRGPFTLPSAVFPGTQHPYWIYVPAQYDSAVP